jgi:hypothetical protein
MFSLYFVFGLLMVLGLRVGLLGFKLLVYGK